MRAKQRSQMIRYADRILGALNRVELLRECACSGQDFSPNSEKAVNLWRTAQAMEEAIIRENGLPDIDALLEKIFIAAETFTGMVGGDVKVHSYIKSAVSLFNVYEMLQDVMNPQLYTLLDIISADGHQMDYYPTRAMVEPKPTETAPAETEGGAA